MFSVIITFKFIPTTTEMSHKTTYDKNWNTPKTVNPSKVLSSPAHPENVNINRESISKSCNVVLLHKNPEEARWNL